MFDENIIKHSDKRNSVLRENSKCINGKMENEMTDDLAPSSTSKERRDSIFINESSSTIVKPLLEKMSNVLMNNLSLIVSFSLIIVIFSLVFVIILCEIEYRDDEKKEKDKKDVEDYEDASE